MRDWNSRIGKDSTKGHGCMGKYGGEGVINENEEQMLEFCIDNALLIGNTWFKHKKIHQVTIESPSRQVASIIDYMTYTETIRYVIQDVQVYRSAELSTEHRLLTMKIRLKYHICRRTETSMRK
jgi:hypothetical protein